VTKSRHKWSKAPSIESPMMDEAKPLVVGFNDSCFLLCFDVVGQMTRKTSKLAGKNKVHIKNYEKRLV